MTEPSNWTAETWTALGTWATVFVAGVAAYAGLRQYRASVQASTKALEHAKLIADEEARPYVVASLEHSKAATSFIDLVVRNYGKTAAFEIELVADPALVRSAPHGGLTEAVEVPRTLGVLAPGQEWRTYFDRTFTRDELQLPRRYSIVLRAKDARDEAIPEVTQPLDWTPLIDSGGLEVYGMHDAAKALREMRKTLDKFAEGAGNKGVRVYSRNGDEKDQRERQRRDEWRAREREGSEGEEGIS